MDYIDNADFLLSGVERNIFAQTTLTRSVSGVGRPVDCSQPQLAFGRQTMSVTVSFFGTMPRL